MKTRLKLLAALCVCSAVVAVGCGEGDEIRRYEVPPLAESDDLPPPPSEPATAAADHNHDHEHDHDHGQPRMIVAIIEHEGRNWFFRMLGPAADIPAEVQHYVGLLQSIEFDGSGPQFEVPDHWRELEATGLRFAAYRFGHDAHPIELTVVPLDANAGSLLDNVNRWRGQLDLPPIDEAGLSEVVMRHELSGHEVVIVDIGGGRETAADPHQQPPAATSDAPSADNADGRVQVGYDVPAGWTEREASGMRRASLAVMDGDQMLADVSVIPLSGAAGGPLANVNRWRGQVGLDPIDEPTLQEALIPVAIDDGGEAVYVDLAGEAADDDEPQRILAAIHERGDLTWFIKMTGDAEAVAQQREAFEEFVASIRFEADGGES